MSNVIDFLERLGQDAQLRYATNAEIEQALAGAQIDPAVRAAILGEDQLQLEALLGAATNVCCMVHPAEEEDDDLEEDDDEDDDDDELDEDDGDVELKSQRCVANCAAAAR
jgi:hypothetical protein